MEQIQPGDYDQEALLPVLAQPVNSSDPLACLCCCKFKRLGHGYILYERSDGDGMKTTLLVVGPHWIGVLVTLSIVLLCTGMFLFQCVATMPWYNTLMTLGLCGTTLYYLFQTSCTDPGIVQPLQHKKDESLTQDESEATELEAEHVAIKTIAMESSVVRYAHDRRLRPTRRRFCDICSIQQDCSTDHCEDCGVCIAGHDHHCPWMSKCIGRGNKHAFRMFNISWIISVVFVICIAISGNDQE
uniref:Palmitoyltransferase n=1 Tax=Hyaloperonospora arabidopsidis (strain Emoy2) TaxID=559515 RepID=M4BFB6_HYAAE